MKAPHLQDCKQGTMLTGPQIVGLTTLVHVALPLLTWDDLVNP